MKNTKKPEFVEWDVLQETGRTLDHPVRLVINKAKHQYIEITPREDAIEIRGCGNIGILKIRPRASNSIVVSLDGFGE